MDLERRSNIKTTLLYYLSVVCLMLSACSSVPSGSSFGSSLCDCVEQAVGNREKFNQCVATLSQQAIPFFKENGTDSNQRRRLWKRTMVESGRKCQEELKLMGIHLESVEEDWEKRRR